MLDRDACGGRDVRRDVLAVPQLALRDHVGLEITGETEREPREHGLHVEHGELVERAPVDRLGDHRRRQLAAAIEKPRPAHAGVDAQQRAIHIEERGDHRKTVRSSRRMRMLEQPCVTVDARIEPVAERIQPNNSPEKNVARARGSPSFGRWIERERRRGQHEREPDPASEDPALRRKSPLEQLQQEAAEEQFFGQRDDDELLEAPLGELPAQRRCVQNRRARRSARTCHAAPGARVAASCTRSRRTRSSRARTAERSPRSRRTRNRGRATADRCGSRSPSRAPRHAASRRTPARTGTRRRPARCRRGRSTAT